MHRLLARLFDHGEPAEVGDASGGGHGSGGPSVITGLEVSVDEPDARLRLGVDESYTLDVPPTGGVAKVSAKTVFGAFHGLESFSQLVAYNFSSEQYDVQAWHIEDAPRFPHRGLLVDPGRHFLAMPHLLALIDSMAMAKLNTLHWHLTEDQSWPIASRSHPEFPQNGAFGPEERYSWKDVEKVVAFARDRGIRVVPEIDMPGHTASWFRSHPELAAPGCPLLAEEARQNLLGPASTALDPSNPRVFTMIKELLTDWRSLFEDGIIHLGADEVPEDCWHTKEVQSLMETHGLDSYKGVFSLFVNKVADIARDLGWRTTFWDEAILSAEPPKDAIIQVWHESDKVLQALDHGNDVIFSPIKSHDRDEVSWYLDKTASWEAMYELEPEEAVDVSLAAMGENYTGGRVIGGEACMWGEKVDASNLEPTVWPRLAAVAERLWSPRDNAIVTRETHTRLAAFRCRLVNRGVRSSPLSSKQSLVSIPLHPAPCSD